MRLFCILYKSKLQEGWVFLPNRLGCTNCDAGGRKKLTECSAVFLRLFVNFILIWFFWSHRAMSQCNNSGTDTPPSCILSVLKLNICERCVAFCRDILQLLNIVESGAYSDIWAHMKIRVSSTEPISYLLMRCPAIFSSKLFEYQSRKACWKTGNLWKKEPRCCPLRSTVAWGWSRCLLSFVVASFLHPLMANIDNSLMTQTWTRPFNRQNR